MFSERFEEALVFAHQLHRKQKRKTSGAPYAAHLLGVAALVMEDGGSEDESIAALLHDSLEDQSHVYPGGAEALALEIGRKFGASVLGMVEALTERRSLEERGIRDKRERWRVHKETYIRQIRSADPSVRRISCADSVYNVRSLTRDYLRMGDELWTRFLTRSRDDQLWAYDAVARAMLAGGGGPLAEELSRAVDELYRIAEVSRPASMP